MSFLSFFVAYCSSSRCIFSLDFPSRTARYKIDEPTTYVLRARARHRQLVILNETHTQTAFAQLSPAFSDDRPSRRGKRTVCTTRCWHVSARRAVRFIRATDTRLERELIGVFFFVRCEYTPSALRFALFSYRRHGSRRTLGPTQTRNRSPIVDRSARVRRLTGSTKRSFARRFNYYLL